MSALLKFLEIANHVKTKINPTALSEEALAHSLIYFQKLEKAIGEVRDVLKHELFRRANNICCELLLDNIKFTVFDKAKVSYDPEACKQLAQDLDFPLETFGTIDLIPDPAKIEALAQAGLISPKQYQSLAITKSWFEYRAQKNATLLIENVQKMLTP